MSGLVVDRLSESEIKRALAVPGISSIRGQSLPLMVRFNSARDGGSWYLLQYNNRKRPRRKVGAWPLISVKLMSQKVADLVAENTAGNERIADSFTLVSDLLDWHLERITRQRDLSDERRAGVKSMIVVQLLPRFDGVHIAELNERLVDARLVASMQADYAPSYIKQCFSVLKTALNDAVKMKLVDASPIAHIKITDFRGISIQPKPPGIRANVEPVKAVLAQIACAALQPLTLCLMMLLHGTRIGETRRAKWEDFDWSARTWRIPEQTTKTKTEHVLPLTDFSYRLLLNYRKQQTVAGHGRLLFTSDDKAPISKQTANEWVQTVSARKWHSHDLRKLARTVWADIGVEWYVGEIMLNHTVPGLSKTYIHSHLIHKCRDALGEYHAWLNDIGLNKLIEQQTIEKNATQARHEMQAASPECHTTQDKQANA